MEPLVTLEGVKKLPGGLEHPAAAIAAREGAKSGVPLDGRTVLYTSLDRETLLIAGVGEAFANSVPAILNDDPKENVTCTMAVFPPGGRVSGKKRPFVAIVTMRPETTVRPERVTIRSQGHSFPFAFKKQADDLSSFLQDVQELTGQSQADIVDGLIQALLAGGASPRAMQSAARIVETVAEHDGFIEVLGTFDEGDTYVQGWAKGMPTGTSRVFILDGTLKLGVLTCCLFERKDTSGKAFGFSGLLDTEGGLDTAAARKIFFRGRSGWNAVNVHERRTMAPPRALPSHIRALLPGLAPAGDGKTRLEQASQRFDGRETVSELDVPVRVGIDFSAAVDHGGVLLSGWLLNPEDRVEAVLFRAGALTRRLDAGWTTQRRPDVTCAFATLSPFLNGPDAQQRHGFLTHVQGEGRVQSEAAYLEIVLKDGRSAYAPLALGRASLRSALRRLVSGLDPATAFRADVLERHLLPMVESTKIPDPAIIEVVDVGSVAEEAEVALVIGLDGDFDKSRVLLSLCALDPFLRKIPIVLAASRGAATEQIEDFRRLAGFYGLAVRLVLADHVEDSLDALQVGAEATRAEAVICLASDVLPREAGWAEPLIAAFHANGGTCMVAPSLLYEDDTIRWAGAWIEPEDGSHHLKQPYLGYPRRTLHGAEVSRVAATPFDCCVVPGAALGEAGGFSRKFLGTDEKGLDAALRLRVSGIAPIWLPQVEMIHPEGGHRGERNWKKLVSELDRRSFDRIWFPLLPTLAEDI